jgi:hypothetical protein
VNRRDLFKSLLALVAVPKGNDKDRFMAMLDRAGVAFDTPAGKVVLKVDGMTVTGVEHETAEFLFTKSGALDRVVLWSTDFDSVEGK